VVSLEEGWSLVPNDAAGVIVKGTFTLITVEGLADGGGVGNADPSSSGGGESPRVRFGRGWPVEEVLLMFLARSSQACSCSLLTASSGFSSEQRWLIQHAHLALALPFG